MNKEKRYTEHTTLSAFNYSLALDIINGEAKGHALVAISAYGGGTYSLDTSRHFTLKYGAEIFHATAAAKEGEQYAATFGKSGIAIISRGNDYAQMQIARPIYSDSEYIGEDLKEGEPCVYIPQYGQAEPPVWKIGIKDEADFVVDSLGRYIQAERIYRLSELTRKLLGKEANFGVYEAATSLAEMELEGKFMIG